MCRAVQEVVGEHIVKGILSVPVGTSDILAKAGGRWVKLLYYYVISNYP